MSLRIKTNQVAMALGAMAAMLCGSVVFAAAPVLAPLPRVIIGDLEDSTQQQDTNRFLFPNAFTFTDFAADVDTPSSGLMWSFGEFSGETAVSRYLINGKPPVNAGDAAIAADQNNGHPNAMNPADENNISLGFETASFRDIVFSPLPDQPVYSDPDAVAVEEAALGKVIRYYVSDGQNVVYRDSHIQTVNDEIDSTSTSSIEYDEVYRQFGAFGDDWQSQGLAWEAVTIHNTGEALQIMVYPSQGRSRIFGWRNSGLLGYDSVGPDKFVRGKFYIYTDVFMLEPLNHVPNFRIGLMNEDAVRSTAHFELASTGVSDPGYEPFYGTVNDPEAEQYTNWLRPADNAISPTPSLYRLDFDPVDVPAAELSTIGAFMESYTVADPANGSLYLSEIVLGTYTALDNTGEFEWAYYRDQGLQVGAGGTKILSGGAFNHEANLSPGHLQDLYLPGMDEQGFFVYADEGAGGIVGDTDAVSSDVFGVGLINLESASNVDKLRIAPGRLYHARYYATSHVPIESNDPEVETQGMVRFRFQTVANRVSYLLEIMTRSVGTIVGASTPNADHIAAQALPGQGSLNPHVDPALDTPGEGGGWYSLVVPSPMDTGGIRNDVETYFGTTQNTFFALSGQPGPGDTENSARDVILGIDLIQAPETVLFAGGSRVLARPNRAMVRLSALEVYSYPAIDDGGFDYSQPGE